MSDLVSLFMMIVFIVGIVLLLVLQPITGFATTGMIMRRAVSAPGSLVYVGRFVGAVLHWEKSPILDIVIEYKFPVKHLPRQTRKEDVFQSGLYALALLDSGLSCSSTRLVTI